MFLGAPRDLQSTPLSLLLTVLSCLHLHLALVPSKGSEATFCPRKGWPVPLTPSYNYFITVFVCVLRAAPQSKKWPFRDACGCLPCQAVHLLQLQAPLTNQESPESHVPSVLGTVAFSLTAAPFGQGCFLGPFYRGETEEQRGENSCLRPHSQKAEELAF